MVLTFDHNMTLKWWLLVEARSHGSSFPRHEDWRKLGEMLTDESRAFMRSL
jgi:hypothetical protein